MNFAREHGLLLAVAFGPDGPAAFCQFVPAPGINGYSLDVTPRADGSLALSVRVSDAPLASLGLK